jgi:hypothetical protein
MPFETAPSAPNETARTERPPSSELVPAKGTKSSPTGTRASKTPSHGRTGETQRGAKGSGVGESPQGVVKEAVIPE